MARDVMARTASGSEFVIPEVRQGQEWRVERELALLLGEPVQIGEKETRRSSIRQKSQEA